MELNFIVHSQEDVKEKCKEKALQSVCQILFDTYTQTNGRTIELQFREHFSFRCCCCCYAVGSLVCSSQNHLIQSTYFLQNASWKARALLFRSTASNKIIEFVYPLNSERTHTIIYLRTLFYYCGFVLLAHSRGEAHFRPLTAMCIHIHRHIGHLCVCVCVLVCIDMLVLLVLSFARVVYFCITMLNCIACVYMNDDMYSYGTMSAWFPSTWRFYCEYMRMANSLFCSIIFCVRRFFSFVRSFWFSILFKISNAFY